MERANVVVIGGGLIGSSIAWRLAQRGGKVILVERGEIGNEASWAGGGVLIPSAGEGSQPLFTLFRDSHLMYPAFVAEVQDVSGTAFEYRTNGQLILEFD